MFVPFSPVTVVILFFVVLYAIYEHFLGKYNEFMIERERNEKRRIEREEKQRMELDYARKRFNETLKEYETVKRDSRFNNNGEIPEDKRQ